jgi:predicted amidohydrolase YtcJ
MKRTALIICTLLSAYSCNYKSLEADVVFHNCVVIDCDGIGEESAVPLAIAVKDGRIVAVGAEHAIRNTYRATELIDLRQSVVYPGFIDAHAHFVGYALKKLQVDLVGTESYADVLDRLVEFSLVHPEGWLTGRGWDQNDWASRSYPTRHELDLLFPSRPVAIRRIGGHALLANTAALKITGLLEATYIEGGEIVLLDDGSPSGVLIDSAAEKLLKHIPKVSDAVKRLALMEAEKDLFARGLTSVVDAGLDVGDIRLIDAMHKSGELQIRVVAMASGTQSNLDSALAQGPWRTDRLVAESIKFYMDGALGSRGAALLEPYSDRTDYSGYLLQDSLEYSNALRRAYEGGFQACTHGIGDRSVRNILNHYYEILGGVNDRRWRIEHSQVVAAEDLALYERASVIPSVQPTHATSDMYWAGERLGKGRIRRAYRYKDLKNVLGMIPLGTDMPIEDIDPLKTFYAATVRKDAEGYPEEGFYMDQALDRNSTLLGMTVWASMANNTDADVGSIEVGKWADFVVLDRNLLTVPADDVLDALILRTVVAGITTFNSSED